MSATPGNNLSAYEVARLERIKFIQDEIKKIGMLKRIQNTQKDMKKDVTKPKKKLRIKHKKPLGPRRRRTSGRLAGKKVEYSKEIVYDLSNVEKYRPNRTGSVCVKCLYLFSFQYTNLQHQATMQNTQLTSSICYHIHRHAHILTEKTANKEKVYSQNVHAHVRQ